jgi:hypothetical protein
MWLDPNNAVKRRVIDHTEGANKFCKRPKTGRDRLVDRVDRLVTPGL